MFPTDALIARPLSVVVATLHRGSNPSSAVQVHHNRHHIDAISLPSLLALRRLSLVGVRAQGDILGISVWGFHFEGNFKRTAHMSDGSPTMEFLW